jgi:hypothetical protein
MKTNYFNSALIKPTVTASLQHGAAFADGDVFFNWTGFEIPRGTTKLLGATVQLRPRANAAQTPMGGGINLLIARGPSPDASPASIGTLNAGIISPRQADVIAHLKVNTNDVFGKKTLFQSSISSCETVIEPNPNSGSNVGVDKFYIAGLATDTMSMGSDLTVSGNQATNQAVLNIASVDGTLVFVNGDVIHDQDNRLMGTAKLVDDAQITMEANLANTGVDTKKLYNINPVRIILHFSK